MKKSRRRKENHRNQRLKKSDVFDVLEKSIYDGKKSIHVRDRRILSAAVKVKRRIQSQKLKMFGKFLKNNSVKQVNFHMRDYVQGNRELHEIERDLICYERRERRKNLFESGKIGKGIKGPKHKRITEKSNVRC